MSHIDVSLDMLPDDQPIRLEAGAFGIVVMRTNHTVVAYEDRCPHAQWRLSGGEVIGGRLECPGHGWEFAVSTGECITAPTHRLRALRVEMREGGTVRVVWDERPVPIAAPENR